MKITPERLIFQFSANERICIQQYPNKDEAAWKVLKSATNIDGDTFDCECSVDEFQSILKALRMKSGTGRIV